MSHVSDFPKSVHEKARYRPAVGATGLQTRQEGRGKIVYICDKGDLAAALNVVAGFPPEAFPGGKLSGHRAIPLRHPDYPNALIADDVDAEDLGLDRKTGKLRTHAEFTVIFKTPTYQISGNGPDVFLTVEYEEHERAILIPASCLMFSTPGNFPVTDQLRVIKGQKIMVTAHGLSGIDKDVVASYADSVNATMFRGYGPGQLLFGSVTGQQTVAFDGSTRIDATFNFLYSGLAWNLEPMPYTSIFTKMTYLDGTYRYLEKEFNNLF